MSRKYIVTEDQLRRANILAFEYHKPVIKIGIEWEPIEEYTDPCDCKKAKEGKG